MKSDQFSLGSSQGSITISGDGGGQTPLYHRQGAAPPSTTLRDVKRYTREGTNAVMSSVFGVSTLAALVGGSVLLLIRPAFVIQRGKRDSVDLTRVAIWMTIVFAVVAFRDQYIQVYRCAMDLRSSVVAA